MSPWFLGSQKVIKKFFPVVLSMASLKQYFFFSLFVLLMSSGYIPKAHSSFLDSETIHIGVLAKSGKEACFEQWSPTADYLEQQLGGKRVQLVCMDFEEAEKVVRDKHVDFTITDPSMYVNFEYKYGVSRITTLKNKRARSSYTQFGGVIFYHADRKDIHGLEDLKGKKFMAVAENSFGGWLVSHRYMMDRGIDPRKDFSELLFGGDHEKVVRAVDRGTVDAGCVRTDALERMAWEQKIDLRDFEIIDLQEMNEGFDFLRTTRLYPEWPLAKVKHTNQKVAKEVALAMLQMDETSKAAKFSRSMGWTIPLDYHEVHDCLRLLKVPPYTEYGKISLGLFYQHYKLPILLTVAFLGCILFGVLFVVQLNRKLKTTLIDLDHEHRERSKIIAHLNEFKMTLDQTLDCVFMFSAKTLHFIYVNKGALDHIGYSREELLKMTPLDIRVDTPESEFREMLGPLIANPESPLRYISSNRKKDGTVVPVEVFMQYVVTPDQEGRFVAIVRDITIRLEKEAEREQLQSRLLQEQKLASVGQLAAGIAHEINTPAQYLGTNIDFLEEAFQDGATLIDKFEKLLSAAQEKNISDELIADVEDCKEEMDWAYLMDEIPKAISQSTQGIQQISSIVLAMKNFAHPSGMAKEAANLNELLTTTLTVSRNEWKYHAEPVLELDENLPLVNCVRNEIVQVFLNLIVNGAHAIAEKKGGDGGKGQITISTQQEDDKAVIRISDTGSGISEENLEKVFNPFFTTKEVGKGTGQGLTIAYDIVTQKHDGSLDVNSEVGTGTTFTITLPLDQ